jgi:RND family efflux transporter MFP subunit
MTTKLSLVGSACLALLVVSCSRSEAQPAPPPKPTVSVVVVTPEAVRLSSEWIATLDGFVNAQIRPQVSGYLVKKTYEEGQAVKKGQVLFEIDPRPFQASLAQAAAQVAQAEAQVNRTAQDVKRNTALAKEGLAPQAQVDTDTQANLAAQAAVKSAQASRAIAELNLGFTKVRSLVDGIAAIATAQLGDLVNPSTLLTTVSQVDPIKTYFSLSEQEYLRVADQLNRSDSPAAPWQSGTALTLITADGKEYESPGTFLAADREIDPKTGTIRISATFPNPKRILRPGQYGRVRAETQVIESALLVPGRAITELQGKALLRVVGADGKVQVKSVTLGQRVGGRRIVERGLEPNSSVIIDAVQLPAGTPVNTKKAAPPASSASAPPSASPSPSGS